MARIRRPWAVTYNDARSEHTSEAKAYEQVRSLVANGADRKISVHRWERDANRWCLFDTVDPAEAGWKTS